MKRTRLLAFAALALFGLIASAQPWPSRPIRWIVPIPPGGGPDIIARRIAPALAERLGQPVIVENHPGGAHNVAMQMVALSEPEGYVLLHAVTSLVTNPHLYRLAFDPVRDLVPVARVASTEWVLVARGSLPVNRLEDLVAFARTNRTTCAITGGVTEIACRMLAALSGANFVPVPYRGGPQVFNDMMGGFVDLRFAEASIAAPLVKGGRIRALATLNPRRRLGEFGDLPTLSETYPSFEFLTWQGIMVRAGTPREIISRLSAAFEAMLTGPELSQAVRATGNQPAYAAPQVFDEIIRKDLVRYGALIRELGMRVEQ
jgi:tripartite-type tricarboxylate transporter receptor subunit TctC